MRAFFVRIFFTQFAIGMVVPMTVIWQLEQGMSIAQIGLLVAWWRVSVLLLEIPTGVIADRFGRRVSLILNNIVYVIAYGLMPFVGTFAFFIGHNTVRALGFTLSSGAAEAYVFDALKKDGREGEYKRVWSRVNVVDEIATIIGALLASALVATWGLPSVFFIACGMMAAGAFVSIFWLKEVTHTPNPENAEEAMERKPRQIFREIGELHERYRFLNWAFVVFALIAFPAKMLWEPQMLSIGLTAAQIAFVYAAIKPFAIVGSLIGGRHKRAVRARDFVWISLGMAVVFALIAISQQWVTILALGVFYLFENLFRILMSDYLNERIASRYRATVLSAASLGASVFATAAVIIFGAIGDISLMIAFIGMAILKLVTAFAAMKLRV